MEFCSSCKSLMVPKKDKGGTILVCSSCGHKIKNFKIGKYRIKERVSQKRKDILVIEEEKRKTTAEQRKYINDLYGKEAYEASEE